MQEVGGVKVDRKRGGKTEPYTGGLEQKKEGVPCLVADAGKGKPFEKHLHKKKKI